MGCNTSRTKNSIIMSSSRHTPQISPQKASIRPATFVFHKQSSILDDYQMGPILGSGAFGLVRMAVQKSTGLDRAVKSIKKSKIAKDPQSKSSFFNEIEILKQIDHPNILRIFEFYEDSNCFHLVTELLSGGELFEFLTSQDSLSESISAHFIHQVLSAVNYCHQEGIVHRDLKPENLLLESKSSGSQLKVIDFGAAAIYNGKTPLKARFGTCYYIAPEVLKGEYNEKCDIWSCGVILYIMLSGRPPFNGKNDSEILSKIKNGAFSFPPNEWSRVSSEAKDLIQNMINYNPETRFSAQQALNHSWFTNLTQRNSPLPSIVSNLTQFRASQKLQHAVLTFISSQLISKKELSSLAENFKSMDKNGDGKLSKQELIEEFSKTMSMDQALDEVNRILELVDLDHNGYIDYSEFLMASMKKETIESKKNLEAAFKLFDLDGNGTISTEELRNILGEDSNSDTLWEEVVAKVDQNGDGSIDLKEFKDMMMKLIDIQ